MSVTHVVGVDPGLVHTGVVRMIFNQAARLIEVEHAAVKGDDAEEVRDWILETVVVSPADDFEVIPAKVWIEGYRPRSHMNTDARMQAAVRDMHKAIRHSTVLDNTGVKKVVRRPLMEACGVWNFTTPTHHQDLRSAARIALYGMLKDPALNRVLSDVVRDIEDGKDWMVIH